MTEKTILFFDGVCGLCNGFVDFLFRIDSKGEILVAAIQGATAKKFLPADLLVDFQTIVVRRNDGGLMTKSDGVLYVLGKVGGFWSNMATVARIAPKFIRDFVYDLVARSRYSIFGKRQTCRLPSVEERSRFLD